MTVHGLRKKRQLLRRILDSGYTGIDYEIVNITRDSSIQKSSSI